MQQFLANGIGHRHAFEQGGEKLDLVEEHEVVKRSRIGDRSYHSEAEAFQIGEIAFEIFHIVGLVDASILQKPIKFEARLETQYSLQLGECEMACPMRFDRQRFECLPLDVSAVRDETLGKVIRNLDRDVHAHILAWRERADKPLC